MNWLPVLFGTALLVTFFLPWLQWKDAVLSGTAMPSGGFFEAAKEKFGVDNPFPKFSFALKIFWLIPLAALAVIVSGLMKKNMLWPALIAGLLSLSLVLVYFLFSKTLVEQLGVSKSAWAMTRPWLFVHTLAAVAVILSAGNGKWFLKIGLILATCIITFAGFTLMGKQAEERIMKEIFESTADIKPDYTMPFADLLKEFVQNDSAANKKYMEKVLLVTGNVSAVELSADSTGTITFEDSTGSYAIFSLEKNQYEKVKNIKPGDAVSLKGSCSGSVYSDILNNTQISFKRSVLNKQN